MAKGTGMPFNPSLLSVFCEIEGPIAPGWEIPFDGGPIIDGEVP